VTVHEVGTSIVHPFGSVYVVGHSLGAAVALQAAAEESRIRAVVAAAPFSDLRTVFTRCREAGVAIAVCTDNPGRNPSPCTLPGEYERLIDHDVIDFHELKEIQNEAFRSAFGFVGTTRLT